MATGIYSTAENTPIYPTVKAIYSYYFDIYTQDDASRNDGSFNFQVISTADWGFVIFLKHCHLFGTLPCYSFINSAL